MRSPLRRSGAGSRRGAMLLEAVVSLGLFVAAGMAILASLDRSATALRAARETTLARDLAATAMAKIEAGLETPLTLNGPVEEWPTAGGGSPSSPSRWVLDIKTEPSQFAGLTKVTIKASKLGASEEATVGFTLRQLVRLSAAANSEADVAGPLNVPQGGEP